MAKSFIDYNEHNSMGRMAGLKLWNTKDGFWNTIILDSNPGSSTFQLYDLEKIMCLLSN